MKALLEAFGSVIHIDATYKVLKCGYILVTLNAIDNSGTTVLCAWAIIASETTENYIHLFQCLVENSPESVSANIQYAVMDKSAPLIKALVEVLPHVKFVICRFHSIQAVATWIRKLSLKPTQQHYKEILKKLFSSMVYSPDEKGYTEAFQSIQEISKEEPELEIVGQYFDEHWHALRDHFSLHSLKSERIFKSFTNNRTENINQQIKRAVRYETTIPILAQALFDLEAKQSSRMEMDSWIQNNTTMTKYNLIDKGEAEIQRAGGSLLSRSKLKDTMIEYRKSKSVNIETCSITEGQIACSRKDGVCTYNATNGLPCQHLFATRFNNLEPLLTRDMIADRWLIFFSGNSPQTAIQGAVDTEHNVANKEYECGENAFETMTNDEERSVNENNSARTEKRSPNHVPLSRERYNMAKKVCSSFSDILNKLSTENASFCLLQLESLDYKWRRNIHTKINLDETMQALPNSEKMYDKSEITKRTEDLCETLPEMLSKLCNQDLKNCIDQLELLKQQWKCQKKVGIDVLDSSSKLTTGGSHDSEIGLVPNGRSRYRTKGNSTSSWKKSKNAKKTQIQRSEPAVQAQCERNLTQEEQDIINAMSQKGCDLRWSAKDFDVLQDISLKGTQLYLSDHHMEYSMCLLREKYTEVCGLQNPILYESQGFTPVHSKPFVQPIHAGYKHWVCLSNIQTLETGSSFADTYIDLYDSLYRLPKNPSEVDLSPAVVWQAAQLLRNRDPQHHKQRSIYVRVRPVEQQRNVTDCGLFSIFNAVTLLSGNNPGEVHYHPLLRDKLFNAIKSGEFDGSHIIGKRTAISNYKFQHNIVSGNITHKVDIPEDVIEINVFCHCQMPESFGDLIQCEKCENLFHSSCYLISQKVAAGLDSFICYDCREIQNYTFCMNPSPFDSKSLSYLLESIKDSGPILFRKLLPLVFARPSEKRLLISNTAQLKQFEHILSAFDLTAYGKKAGSLYETLQNINKDRGENQSMFLTLNIAELIHFGVLVICERLKKECRPIYTFDTQPESLSSDQEVVGFLKLNKKWVKEIGSEVNALSKKVVRFCDQKKFKEDPKDFIATCYKDLNSVEGLLKPITDVAMTKEATQKHATNVTAAKHEKELKELKANAENILLQVENSRTRLAQKEDQLLK